MRSLPISAALAIALTPSARAQTTMTYSIVLSTNGPVTNGTAVNGTLHCSWAHDGATGYAGGAFRFRMDGLGVADVLVPNNNGSGLNGETSNQRVAVPITDLPPGYGTVNANWTSGRRPKRAYLTDVLDPTALESGGGFRFPPTGSGPTDMRFSIEQQSGITYLTGRNGAGVENRIEHAQIPRGLQADPLFFEPSADFDLFKFQVRAPLSGTGTATITPEILSSVLYTSDQGSQAILSIDQIHVLGASFTYTPAPSALAPLAFGLAAMARPRARRYP